MGTPGDPSKSKSRPPRDRESKVQRSLIVRLARLGISLERRNVGAREWTDKLGRRRVVKFARAGQSDLWGLDWPSSLPWARHWEIETKRDGEEPTPAQTRWLHRSHNLGCVSFWTDNANYGERVAEAILAGGRIRWHDELNDNNFDYDVEMPQ